MDREAIIRALEMCSSGMSCDTCDYCNLANCNTKLHEDAVALLREPLKANEATKYSAVCIYTKKTNLLDYFSNQKFMFNNTKEQHDRMREYYAREREVELIAMFRWENGKQFCKIKCPINPLPVQGEFEVVSVSVLNGFLVKNGWLFKEKLYPRMFQ